MAERINAGTVTAALEVLDDDAKAVAGGMVVSLALTTWAVRDLAPREWEDLAAYLLALTDREPVKSSPAYAGHRIVLGTMASELRSFAHSAGEPVGLQADLRSAGSQAEERRIKARIADEHIAFERAIDDILTAHATQREITAPAEEEIIDQDPDAAPTLETDDALAFL